jgi:uncharacterized membrane protein (UPF0127 family)
MKQNNLAALRRLTFATFSVFAALAFSPALAADLPTLALTIRSQHINVEVAATRETREHGLMQRFSLRPDQGMLFVFTQPQPIAMWMKNTYIPLSVAFIDGDGKILNIEDMQPQTETTHPSSGAALYALEMRLGWFKQHGIGPGVKIEGLEKAPKAVN